MAEERYVAPRALARHLLVSAHCAVQSHPPALVVLFAARVRASRPRVWAACLSERECVRESVRERVCVRVCV